MRARTVLTDVPQDSKLVKVATPSLSANSLLESDLNVRDVVLVERAVEEHVSEPQHEQVLDHLLPKIVVDSERLVLGPLLLQVPHHLPRRLEVLSKGLLDDDSVDAGFGVVVLLETLGDGGEDGRGESHLRSGWAKEKA